ncbi:MAG: hypothetical protein ACLFNT_11365, partial [Spirochaetales bacterium]
MQLETIQHPGVERPPYSSRSANPVRYAYFGDSMLTPFAFALSPRAHVGYEWNVSREDGSVVYFRIAGIAEFGRIKGDLVFGFGATFRVVGADGTCEGFGELLLAPDY